MEFYYFDGASRLADVVGRAEIERKESHAVPSEPSVSKPTENCLDCEDSADRHVSQVSNLSCCLSYAGGIRDGNALLRIRPQRKRGADGP